MSVDVVPPYPLPLVHLDTVTHIGTLRQADKGERGASHEGTGLSFSQHPEDWEAIARLGGAPWWEVDLSTSRILDGHLCLEDPAFRDILVAWGERRGLVAAATVHAVSWCDDEWGVRQEMLFATASEAADEFDWRHDEGDDSVTVQERSGWLPLPPLLQAMGHAPTRSPRPDPSVLQDLLTLWAQSQGFDGLWWADDYDPACLSAPRGVVFADRVPGLQFRQVRSPVSRSKRATSPR